MDPDGVRLEVKRLAAEYDRQHAIATEATRIAAGLYKVIEGYLDMFPDLAAEVPHVRARTALSPLPALPDAAPGGAEAVRIILQQHPNEAMYVSTLVGLLKERNWLPDSDNPANVIRTALERLVVNPGETDVYKYRVGNNVYYQYEPDREPPLPGFEDEPF